jgi:hypothetical protein
MAAQEETDSSVLFTDKFSASALYIGHQNAPNVMIKVNNKILNHFRDSHGHSLSFSLQQSF